MIELAWPFALLLLPLPLIVRWLWRPSGQQRAALQVPFYAQLKSLYGGADSDINIRSARNPLFLICCVLCWLLLVLAASRPQWIGDAVRLPASGRDLMLAVDISGSMDTKDMEINANQVPRLAIVKQVLSDFISRRKGDRVGLILFGSQAYLQAPLTFDRHTVETLLLESQIGFAGEKTAIGDAIGLAVKRLRDRPESSRLLILLTDGANTAGAVDPIQATELAQSLGIKIHAIGVGATRMEVPGLFGGNFGARTINPSAELDEGMLKQIAHDTGGQYFRAHDPKELEQIYALLDQLEPIAQEDESFNPTRSLYMWPLAAAFVLALMLVFARLLPAFKLKQPAQQTRSSTTTRGAHV